MNDQQFKKYKIYAYGTGALALLAALFITVFYGRYYDVRAGLFDRGTPMLLLWIGLSALLIFALSALFTLKSDELPFLYPQKCSLFTLFASSFTAVCLLCTLVFFVFAKEGDKMADIYYSGIPEMANAAKMLGITFVFAVLGAGYLFTVCFMSKPLPLLGLTLELWLLSYLLLIYYDMSELVMDPLRTLTVISLCFAALFVLCELRYLYGKSSPRAFVIFSSLCSVITFASGFYKVLSVFTGEALLDTAFVFYVAEAGLAIYAFSRLLNFTERSAFDCSFETARDEGYKVISGEDYVSGENYVPEEPEQDLPAESGDQTAEQELSPSDDGAIAETEDAPGKEQK